MLVAGKVKSRRALPFAVALSVLLWLVFGAVFKIDLG
jgi:hypothetical protein